MWLAKRDKHRGTETRITTSETRLAFLKPKQAYYQNKWDLVLF